MEPISLTSDRSHSPIAALGADATNVPPVLIAPAGRDDPAINTTIDRRFVGAANAGGATLDLLTHPTGHHGFDILDANDRSRQIIRRTLDTLGNALGVR
jgi:dienelactone hydrolase